MIRKSSDPHATANLGVGIIGSDFSDAAPVNSITKQNFISEEVNDIDLVQLPALRTNRVSKEIRIHKKDTVTTMGDKKLFKTQINRK